jgi:phosphate transport system permease protein
VTNTHISILEASTSSKRRRANAAANVWMVGSVVVALVPLALVMYFVVVKGIGQLSAEWFTEPIPAVTRRPGPGMAPAIVGTLLITFGAAVMAVPLGVLGAIYLHEYGGKGKLASTLRFMTDVMTGVPSIVMGLFIYTIFTVSFGLAGIGGSLALAALMLPIVIRSTEEMLKLVSDELRNGSYALGNRKWRTIVQVVLPTALPGIISGVMLAIARAAGETAPLLFTIGASRKINLSLFDGVNTALPMQIFVNAQQPFQGAQDRAWGAALTLVGIVFVFTVLSRTVAARFSLGRD